MNRRSPEVINKFSKEFPDAIRYFKRKGETPRSFPVCIQKQAKRAAFTANTTNLYALSEVVSSNTTGFLSDSYICGNKDLQLIVDAGTQWTAGAPMSKKFEASDVIFKASPGYNSPPTLN